MSASPASILKRLHIPMNSYVQAAQAAGAYRTEFDLHKYNQILSELTDRPVSIPDIATAQMTFGYLVQELVRSLLSEPMSMDELFITAQQKAAIIVQDQPWHWTTKDSGLRITKIEEVRRYVAMFEGVEKTSLVDRIAEDFDVSRATAASYLRQLDKEDVTEDSPAKAPPKPKVNKGAEAAKLVQQHFNGSNKADVIQLIGTELDTSKGGAQTFFYAAIKNLNLSIAKPVKDVGESTQDRVRSILADNPTISKSEFIDKAEAMGIKRTTAQTYYYALTSELGVDRKGTEARGRRKTGGKSRAEQVQEFFTQHSDLSKNEMIDKLSEHFTVSRVSAQSYYYAAKKAV